MQAGDSQTTIRVAGSTRDELANMARELGTTMDLALRRLLWQRRALADIERLDNDPELLAEYQAEAHAIAEHTGKVKY